MRHTPPRRALPSLAPAGIALLWACAPGPAAAQHAPLPADDWAAAAPVPRGDAPPALATLELVAARGRVPAPVALPAGLDGRTTRDLAGASYRVWLSRGRTDIGLGLGSLGFAPLPAGGRSDAGAPLVGALATVSLGVRYRLSDRHLLYADASRARGLYADPARDYVSTQVGVEWRPARSTLGFEHGALGMQLDSGYRLSLKVRHGSPLLYLRGRF